MKYLGLYNICQIGYAYRSIGYHLCAITLNVVSELKDFQVSMSLAVAYNLTM